MKNDRKTQVGIDACHVKAGYAVLGYIFSIINNYCSEVDIAITNTNFAL